MVINSVHIDIKNNLLVCSTDAGITLYSLTPTEVSKISEYKIIEGCRLCRLIKSNRHSANVMNAVYLPKTPDSVFCILDIVLPSYINSNSSSNSNSNSNSNANTLGQRNNIVEGSGDNVNNNVGNYDYHCDTPVTKDYVTGRFDLKRPIYNIHLTHDKIIVVHDREIVILGTNTYSVVNTISTHLNTLNGTSLISNESDKYLIYTLGSRCGEVVIVQPSINDHTSYKCHEHEIQCIATDINEKYLATASIRGTNINVYDLNHGNQIFQFKRGSTGATIWDIAISDDLKWMACCSYSSQGTLHIFSLEEKASPYAPVEIKPKVENGKTFFNRLFEDYTKAYFAEDSIINATWSAVQHKLNSALQHTCRFDKTGNLHVVSIDGKHFKVLGGKYNYTTMLDAANLCIVG